MSSLMVRRALRRMRTLLLYGFGALLLLAVLLALFMPGKPWASALLGLGAGGAMFALTWFTTSRAGVSRDLSVGWIALDYLAKVLITLGALMLAKYMSAFDVWTVAILVIAAVVLTAGMQVTAFLPPKTSGSIPSEIDD